MHPRPLVRPHLHARKGTESDQQQQASAHCGQELRSRCKKLRLLLPEAQADETMEQNEEWRRRVARKL